MSDLIPVTVTLPSALVARLDAAAERDERTRSALVRRLLAGVLPDSGAVSAHPAPDAPPPCAARSVPFPSGAPGRGGAHPEAAE
jgi:Ribbon-helix-helix protein, copG family